MVNSVCNKLHEIVVQQTGGSEESTAGINWNISFQK